jgi:hypothetical protein
MMLLTYTAPGAIKHSRKNATQEIIYRAPELGPLTPHVIIRSTTYHRPSQ